MQTEPMPPSRRTHTPFLERSDVQAAMVALDIWATNTLYRAQHVGAYPSVADVFADLPDPALRYPLAELRTQDAPWRDRASGIAIGLKSAVDKSRSYDSDAGDPRPGVIVRPDRLTGIVFAMTATALARMAGDLELEWYENGPDPGGLAVRTVHSLALWLHPRYGKGARALRHEEPTDELAGELHHDGAERTSSTWVNVAPQAWRELVVSRGRRGGGESFRPGRALLRAAVRLHRRLLVAVRDEIEGRPGPV